jgi:hypothetical protein
MLERPPAGAPSRCRSRTTNAPVKSRHNLNSAPGRRVSDLYRAALAAMGNPIDAVSQANALAAAELKVAAENERAKLLAGAGNADALVRVENLAARAERKLGIKAGASAKPKMLPIDIWRAQQAEKARLAEKAAGGDA